MHRPQDRRLRSDETWASSLVDMVLNLLRLPMILRSITRACPAPVGLLLPTLGSKTDIAMSHRQGSGGMQFVRVHDLSGLVCWLKASSEHAYSRQSKFRKRFKTVQYVRLYSTYNWRQWITSSCALVLLMYVNWPVYCYHTQLHFIDFLSVVWLPSYNAAQKACMRIKWTHPHLQASSPQIHQVCKLDILRIASLESQKLVQLKVVFLKARVKYDNIITLEWQVRLHWTGL